MTLKNVTYGSDCVQNVLMWRSHVPSDRPRLRVAIQVYQNTLLGHLRLCYLITP